MATKAQQFRHDAERGHSASKPARKPHAGRAKGDAGGRNLSKQAGKKASVATEESRSGRPSRKSSRPSSNRGKNSTVLEYVARVKSEQPQARHNRR